VFLQNYRAPVIFWSKKIIVLLKKVWNRSMAVVDWVHVEDSWVCKPSLNVDRWIKMTKGERCKMERDYTKLTQVVGALGKTAVQARGDGSFLQLKVDNNGGPW
jgi:hypothetical protein